MMNAFSEIAGAIGLSTSAGLNAYLPLLVVALVARYTSLIQLNEPWNVLTSGWVIAVLTVLLLIEMAVDKIPGVDSINDGIQTVGRPLAGAILSTGGSGVAGGPHPVLAFIAGLLIVPGVFIPPRPWHGPSSPLSVAGWATGWSVFWKMRCRSLSWSWRFWCRFWSCS